MKRKILEGTLQNQVFLYRTEDGSQYFQFSYHETSHGFEVDIHMQPDYGNRLSDCDTTHRLPSSRIEVENMICFTPGHNPKTFEEAQIYSTDWAELTHQYILTGETINNQVDNR